MTLEQSGPSVSSDDSPTIRPRAMIHKKILDYASEHPDASIEDIAEEVSGTSPSFVERVFETYGDPANGDRRASPEDTSSQPAADPATTSDPTDTLSPASETAADPASTSPTIDRRQTHTDGGAEMDSTPDKGGGHEVTVDGESVQLTERQYVTLRAVAEDPSATQAEIADAINVSRATISKRLNDVDKFDWSTREAFIEQAFGDGVAATEPASEAVSDAPSGADATGDGAAQSQAIAELESRLDVLETQLDSTAPAGGLEDPELLHKLIHASMDAEYISEAEELRLLRALLPAGAKDE